MFILAFSHQGCSWLGLVLQVFKVFILFTKLEISIAPDTVFVRASIRVLFPFSTIVHYPCLLAQFMLFFCHTQTRFSWQTPLVYCPFYFKEYLNHQIGINKMNNEHCFKHHPSSSRLTARLNTPVLLWIHQSFFLSLKF